MNICLILLVFIGGLNADLVILNVKKFKPESSSSLSETSLVYKNVGVSRSELVDELNLCVLRRRFRNEEDGRMFDLVSLRPSTDVCQALPPNAPDLTDKAVYWRAPKLTCLFSFVAQNLQAKRPAIAIIGSDGPISINTTITNLTLPYLFMPDEFAQKLSNFLSDSTENTISLTSDLSKFDFSLIVIWIIAVVVIILGGLWTKHEFKIMLTKHAEQHTNNDDGTLSSNSAQNENLFNGARHESSPASPDSNKVSDINAAKTATATTPTRQLQETSLGELESGGANSLKKASNNNDKHQITISIGYISVFVLLIIVVLMLLLLYFFYNVMIFFVYVIFCLGSASAFFRIGCLLLDNNKILACQIPKNNLPVLKNHQIEIRKIVLFLISISICVVWFVNRHKSWSWTIQNMMALSLAVNALSYYRISSYKTVTLILVLFFVYDIFMVFITPTFTKGTSIMEAVAFGGKDSAESSTPQDWNNLQFGKREDTLNRLPVVIIVPHLSRFKQLCDYYYDYSVSLLGLGDVLIPGLSVNYAIIFDVSRPNRRFYTYFIVNVFAYLIGLLLAFVGLLTMNTAQPALLYLCPILIIFSLVTALIKKEFRLFWTGEPIQKMISLAESNMSTSAGESATNDTSNHQIVAQNESNRNNVNNTLLSDSEPV